MSQVKDRTGQTYGRLTALRIAGRATDRHFLWECRCECGATTVVRGTNLALGKTRSCAACWREQAVALGKSNKTHGMADTSEHKAWRQMRQRTSNPNNPNYKDYGGRGISMAPEWMGRGGFEKFIAHIGLKADPSLTLDRIDVNGNYEPGNVRWADRLTQGQNRRGVCGNE